ncbi:hypothetical protein SDC9_156323 [bioreactor metagenome]|uniref:Uncharacterized protein n=1 Tax=bioreactor metagenome TaxID=1076179 RepID=A0A645F3X3_9ZZZZ
MERHIVEPPELLDFCVVGGVIVQLALHQLIVRVGQNAHLGEIETFQFRLRCDADAPDFIEYFEEDKGDAKAPDKEHRNRDKLR